MAHAEHIRLVDVAVVVGHLRGCVPDDRAHRVAIRHAAQQVVRGMAKSVGRDPPRACRRARGVEHAAQGRALVQPALRRREDPTRGQSLVLLQNHPLPPFAEDLRDHRQQGHVLLVRVLVVARLRRVDDLPLVVAAPHPDHAPSLVDVLPLQSGQLAPPQPANASSSTAGYHSGAFTPTCASTRCNSSWTTSESPAGMATDHLWSAGDGVLWASGISGVLVRK